MELSVGPDHRTDVRTGFAVVQVPALNFSSSWRLDFILCQLPPPKITYSFYEGMIVDQLYV